MSDNILNVSRRGFLQGMVSTGALVLSVRLIPDLVPELLGCRDRRPELTPIAPSCIPACLSESTLTGPSTLWRTARKWAPAAALPSRSFLRTNWMPIGSG